VVGDAGVDFVTTTGMSAVATTVPEALSVAVTRTAVVPIAFGVRSARRPLPVTVEMLGAATLQAKV
jgi:hypothetical protein